MQSVVDLRLGDDFSHEAPPVGGLGIELRHRKQQVCGPGDAARLHEPGHELIPINDTEAHGRHGHPQSRGGDPEITVERELDARAVTVTGQAPDDRRRALAQRMDGLADVAVGVQVLDRAGQAG